tara:strand:+ start:8330 stop:8923 length:594 start_codon:yes stop_codon:yes gene_type:complete
MPFWSTAFKENVALKDPKRKFRFTVQFTGINASNGGSVLWYAKTASKPKFTIETTEHTFLNHAFHYPGSVKWEDVSVTLVDPGGDIDVAASLSAIVQAAGYTPPTDATNENLTSLSKAKAVGALGQVLITQIDADGNPIETWTLWNGFITGVEFGDLAYGEDDLNELTVTIKYDWARLQTTVPGAAIVDEGTEYFNI